jgi:hypothetical protein
MSGKIKILELDQWSSCTDELKELSLSHFETENWGDVIGSVKFHLIQSLFGHCKIREVDETALPSKGLCWFKNDETGKLKLWRSNYDSSD